jgi:hypothetical protein
LGIKDESSEITVEESVKEKTVEDLPKEVTKLEVEAETETEKDKLVKEPKESKEFEVKKGKKVPNQMEKLFKTGHRLKSENDGNMYEVVGSGNSKKWKLIG